MTCPSSKSTDFIGYNQHQTVQVKIKNPKLIYYLLAFLKLTMQTASFLWNEVISLSILIAFILYQPQKAEKNPNVNKVGSFHLETSADQVYNSCVCCG